MDKLPLWKNDEFSDEVQDGFRPWLEPYLVESDKPLGAVLVCPGGGYVARAEHESGQIARRFNELGFQAFVVHYSVAPRRHPQPIRDASRAMRIIRQQAPGWGVDSNHIAILGFSAGGHLAGSLGVHYDRPYVAEKGELAAYGNRPDALILCYAVISALEFAHHGSFDNLFGEQPSQAQLEEASLERHVDTETPPAFLWHTADDQTVPVENSLAFATACSAAKVPFELHVYPHGPHGLGLAPDYPHIATWSALAGEWLKTLGFPAAASE